VDAPPVVGDETRLGMVFVSLLVSAARAMRASAGDADEITVTTKLEGESRVVVEVGGSGPAWSDDSLRRAFDPPFTTPTGEAVGLGLALSRAIVTSLGGSLTASNEGGGGTTLRVSLPVAPADPR
jgi:C4-dicarboxylate-specific signal transduction histidine kinase